MIVYVYRYAANIDYIDCSIIFYTSDIIIIILIIILIITTLTQVPVAVAYEMKIGAEKNENIHTEISEA